MKVRQELCGYLDSLSVELTHKTVDLPKGPKDVMRYVPMPPLNLVVVGRDNERNNEKHFT